MKVIKFHTNFIYRTTIWGQRNHKRFKNIRQITTTTPITNTSITTTTPNMLKVGIYGSGAVGCYLGGHLQSDGVCDVLFVGRNRVLNDIEQVGKITCSSFLKGERKIEIKKEKIKYSKEISGLLKCHVVLVCMKCVDLEQCIVDLSRIVDALTVPLQNNILIIPFQNGVRGKEIILKSLGKNNKYFHVSGGIVSFNVVWRDKAVFHRSTMGPIFLEETEHIYFDQLLTAFGKTSIPTKKTKKFKEVMYGKLLVNLINPVTALSGIPTKSTLDDRGFRTLWKEVVLEAAYVLSRAHVQPEQILILPTHWLVRVLDSNFGYFLMQFVQSVDSKAYSSMAQDIRNRKLTEINYLCGEIVRLAEELNVKAPLNTKMTELVHILEKNSTAVWKSDDLLQHLHVRKRTSFIDIAAATVGVVVIGVVTSVLAGWIY